MPSASVTTRVTVLPAGASVVPIMVGVVSLVLSGASTVITGAVTSTLPLSLAVPVLPAGSFTVAVTV
ncbi:putative membrane protein [Vibrio cholerae]|nr:putative membrane protein [Vibrio cholerae]